jgi:hypothetical protein
MVIHSLYPLIDAGGSHRRYAHFAGWPHAARDCTPHTVSLTLVWNVTGVGTPVHCNCGCYLHRRRLCTTHLPASPICVHIPPPALYHRHASNLTSHVHHLPHAGTAAQTRGGGRSESVWRDSHVVAPQWRGNALSEVGGLRWPARPLYTYLTGSLSTAVRFRISTTKRPSAAGFRWSSLNLGGWDLRLSTTAVIHFAPAQQAVGAGAQPWLCADQYVDASPEW